MLLTLPKSVSASFQYRSHCSSVGVCDRARAWAANAFDCGVSERDVSASIVDSKFALRVSQDHEEQMKVA